eukprot:5847829-Amphidinium_carterae.1
MDATHTKCGSFRDPSFCPFSVPLATQCCNDQLKTKCRKALFELGHEHKKLMRSESSDRGLTTSLLGAAASSNFSSRLTSCSCACH